MRRRRSAALTVGVVAALASALATGCSTPAPSGGAAAGGPGPSVRSGTSAGSGSDQPGRPGTTGSGAGGTPSAGRVSARYADLELWHCHPEKQDDVCDTANLDVTVVSATEQRVEAHRPAVDPPIDCFYAYPTVDPGSTALSRTFDLPVNPLEVAVVQTTFAPYDEVCRVFAPRYEQLTGAGYRSPDALALLEKGGAQVEEAFDHYLATENHGRPFVLIGHSQGTHMLVRLLRQRFDGDGEAAAALRSQLVSALLLGPVGMVVVPDGDVVGGTFTRIPLCARPTERSCIVAYDSFSDAHPPVSGAPQDGKVRACTNPAALAAGDRSAGEVATPLTGPHLARSTPDVSTPTEVWPDYYRARCARDAAGQPYLEITAHPAAGDTRAEQVMTRFGNPTLHRFDPDFGMRDLLDVVATQARSLPSP